MLPHTTLSDLWQKAVEGCQKTMPPEGIQIKHSPFLLLPLQEKQAQIAISIHCLSVQ